MRPDQSPIPGRYWVIYVLLIALVAMTTTLSFADLAPLNGVVALLIAMAKALLVILYFMHVRSSSRTTWIFAGTGFYWLLILLVLGLSDVLTRSWIPAYPGGSP